MIEPTAVVFDFNYNEAEIFTNEADLRRHLLSYDGYQQHFKIHDGLLYVANARHGEVKYWEPTSVDFGDADENTLTEDMEREAIMQVWNRHDYHKLAGTDNVTLETVQSLQDIIQDGKACGETENQKAQESLLAKLNALIV